MTFSNFHEYKNYVDEIQSFLDETYSPGIRFFDLNRSGRHDEFYSANGDKYQLPWARIGNEKFSSRAVIQLRGEMNERMERALEVHEVAKRQAIDFGNATIIVASDGRMLATEPTKSWAKMKNDGTTVFEYPIDDKYSLVGLNSVIYMHELFTDNYIPTSDRFFSYFHNWDPNHLSGQSLASPAILHGIRQATRENFFLENISRDQSFAQRYITGLTEDMATAMRANQIDNSAIERIKREITGVRDLLVLTADNHGNKAELGQLPATDPTGLLKKFQQSGRNVASAYSLSGDDFGIVEAQQSSAEALYAKKEALALKVKAFTRFITPQAKKFFSYVASQSGIEAPRISWAEPMNPSKATTADAASKTVSVLLQLVDAGLIHEDSAGDRFLQSIGMEQDVIDDVKELVRNRRTLEV